MNRNSFLKRTTAFTLTVQLVLVFAAAVEAVEPGLPSKTSILIAAMRAFATHDPDPSIRNPDWLAERFIGARERALIPDHWSVKALSVEYSEGFKLGPVTAVSRAALIRTRFIDERLKEAVEGGAKQVVILGAGFDSRAYRLRDFLASTRVFEVDYPPTQEYKKQRVRDVLGGFPPNLVFAPIDFTKDKLSVVLNKAGYRTSLRTFVIWEGVAFYIPEDAVQGTLRSLSRFLAPGSSMAVDFMTKSYIEGDPKVPRSGARGFPEWGEPWIFGIADGAEERFFKENGFDLLKKVSLSGSDAEIARLYLTRKDGTLYGGPLATRGPFFSHTGQPGYWVSEMTVARR
jgi:methyltransferase (TIGR00027 family)